MKSQKHTYQKFPTLKKMKCIHCGIIRIIEIKFGEKLYTYFTEDGNKHDEWIPCKK